MVRQRCFHVLWTSGFNKIQHVAGPAVSGMLGKCRHLFEGYRIYHGQSRNAPSSKVGLQLFVIKACWTTPPELVILHAIAVAEGFRRTSSLLDYARC